ncbi:MAG TPA: hypothetical protein VK518_02425 [Puia sp.]|nr:hypothetical protein [Puia sp.]
MQRLLHIFLFIAVPYLLPAQVVTGSWYGHADVEMAGMHNNYLTELVIKQKGTKVEGIFGYYFRDKYQSFFIHGRYNPKTREVTILNIPVIYFNSNSTVNSIDCNTNFRGVLINSKLGSSVKGTFYHDDKYKYTCPDIKVSYTLDKSDNQHDSLSTMAVTSAHVWKPQADDFVVDVAVKAPPAATEQPAPPAKQPDSAVTAAVAPVLVPAKDSTVSMDFANSSTAKAVVTSQPAAITAPAANPVMNDTRWITESFTRRKTVLNRELEVESDSVRLSFYDNGDIDGDSISVFVNSQIILTHQGLAAKAFNVYLHLDSTRDVNEVSMFAENLGRIPPNTALMVLTDGKNRYEVYMSSSLTENATIRLRKKKP